MNERAIPVSESLTVEFKSDRGSNLGLDTIVDTVVAFSNTEGGTLYVGVEDNGVPTGSKNKDYANTQRLTSQIAHGTNPPVQVSVSTLMLDEKGCERADGERVVQIDVPKSTISIIASTKGRVVRRMLKADGSPETVPLYPYEILSRLTAFGQADYSTYTVNGATLDDLSPSELTHLHDVIERSDEADQTLRGCSDEELLSALEMTRRLDDGTVVPTVTGLLIIGKPESIARFLPTAGATFQVLDGTEVRVNKEFNGPLLTVIGGMREALEPWNPEREVEFGMFRESVPEFNRRAFREALVNAFGHRDYTQTGVVLVQITDAGLTISNPGGFIEGITYKNLVTTDPKGRNQKLMLALKRIGLAEMTGRGVDRIYEGSLDYGRPSPDYSASTSTGVKVFIARSAVDEPFMRMIKEEERRTGGNLRLTRLRILDALKQQRRLSISKLADELGLAHTAVRIDAEGLVEAGLVHGIGEGASRAYLLSSKVYRIEGGAAAYVRQTGIERMRYDELVLELAQQQDGSVTTRDVEELLHLDYKQAFRQVKRMVAAGKLEQRGAKRGTRYVLPEERYHA